MLYLQEATNHQGPFDRFNEPVVLTALESAQRHWDYEHFKYTNKRDPSIEELSSAIRGYDVKLGNAFDEAVKEAD